MLSPARPEVLLALVTLLWGSTFVVTKDVVRDAPPLLYVAVRFAIAAVVLVALFPRALRAPRRTLLDGALLGTGHALALVLQVHAQTGTSASKVAFITSFCTALTPTLGYLLYREIPRRQQGIGAAIATVGLVALTWPTGGAAWKRGDLLAACAAAVYAWLIVETARRAPHSDAGPLTAVQCGTLALLSGGLAALARVALAVAPAGSVPSLLGLEARPAATLVAHAPQVFYMAFVCTVFAFVVQTWVQARISATLAAVVFALEPVFATGLAVAVEGESEWPGPRGAVGAALILGGLVVSETRPTTGSST